MRLRLTSEAMDHDAIDGVSQLRSSLADVAKILTHDSPADATPPLWLRLGLFKLASLRHHGRVQ
jgi:hypothetical protein